MNNRNCYRHYPDENCQWLQLSHVRFWQLWTRRTIFVRVYVFMHMRTRTIFESKRTRAPPCLVDVTQGATPKHKDDTEKQRGNKKGNSNTTHRWALSLSIRVIVNTCTHRVTLRAYTQCDVMYATTDCSHWLRADNSLQFIVIIIWNEEKVKTITTSSCKTITIDVI